MNKTAAPDATGIDLDHKLSVSDSFQFDCGPHVPCFTECCAKLDLILTPYDVMRLRRELGMTSSEFLDQYTVMSWRSAHGFPEVMLKMGEGEKRCPFVTEQGCTVYGARPAACRIYPLGRAATTHPRDGSRQEFYFTVREAHCKGFSEQRQWTVAEWLGDQGMEECNRLNDLLMELYVLRTRGKTVELTPQHLQMFVMACYNVERFRDFVFRSGFLKKFAIEPETVEAIAEDDVKLLEFAFRWLRFALFREPVIAVRT
jgi:uncharacterized protein